MPEQTLVVFLVPLRIYAGWVFLLASLSKIGGGWLDHPHLAEIVSGWVNSGEAYSFMGGFLRTVIIPHPLAWSWLIATIELLVGAALLLGAFTRVAASLGMLLVFVYLLAKGEGFAANATSPHLAILLTIILTQPGRTLGVDAALRGRFPSWLT